MPIPLPVSYQAQPPMPELVYWGPKPTIPKLSQPGTSEYARLRLALENLLPADSTELFKYQILVDHLRLEEARLIADAYLNSSTSYTDTIRALLDKFGQPHQLALKKIAGVLRPRQELVEKTVAELQRVTSSSAPPMAEEYQQAEHQIFLRAQWQSFPEDYKALAAGRPVSPTSWLLTLAPTLDLTSGLIRVGGQLRQLEDVDFSLHPAVLDATHPVTHLVIQKYDRDLHHPGPERVFSELRRSFWILRGREAVRKHQQVCSECQRWRGHPSVPRMADLLEARLRLNKPVFYSTGVDCFRPMAVKVGRRQDKHWGIIFRCLTTRAVHLDLLHTMDLDAYLMALRRFNARRGTLAELWSDRRTNFKGAERELTHGAA